MERLQRHYHAWSRLLRTALHGRLPPRLSYLRRPGRAATLVACLALLASTALAILVHGTPSRAASGQPSGFVTFLDTRDNTGFNVDITPGDSFVGDFTFVIPSGAQYHGGQASDLQSNGDGTIGLHFSGTVQLYPAPAASSGSAQPSTKAAVRVNATIDPGQHRATAELTDDTNQQQFVMVTTIPGGEMQAVTAANQAIISQDWAALYSLTTVSDGLMTEAQFAQAMAQQVQQVGAITNITVMSAPQVNTDVSGNTYFTVTEQVTSTFNGTAMTQTMSVEFVLDNGTWKLSYTTT